MAGIMWTVFFQSWTSLQIIDCGIYDNTNSPVKIGSIIISLQLVLLIVAILAIGRNNKNLTAFAITCNWGEP